ncbi:Ubiquitin-protein ligase E3C [Geodia barretti]|uniref:HECT-type E3 ubiquitin transferase n=1 Tax=Geodia barretti TaxID=519541 RepID=A0AA35RXR6_GEOBA|nr:Ubiquitin-protein ligase E3C [Geodia barretti]
MEGFSGSVPGLQFLSRGGQLPSREGRALVERLGTFSTLLSLYLSTLHDAEFYGETSTGGHLPFSRGQLVEMVAVLRDVYVSLHMEKHLPHSLFRAPARLVEMKPSPVEYQQLKQCVYQLLCGLHERDSRRPFCPPRHWEMAHLSKISSIPPDLFLEADEEEPMSPRVAPSVTRSAELLRRAPFVFPFEERVRFFRSLVMQSKRSIRGHLQEFLIGPSLQVQARRNHIYEDAFSDLSQEKDLRLPLKVMLVNAQGLDEPGIDGGGLFREFLSELLKTGFDPNRGYFTSTQDGQLYPNPQAPFLSDNYASHYRFLGAMLGKAMYEHLLVEIPFAGFFLCKLADRGQGRLEAYHLASLDPELYRNVLSLKNYEGRFGGFGSQFHHDKQRVWPEQGC